MMARTCSKSSAPDCGYETHDVSPLSIKDSTPSEHATNQKSPVSVQSSSDRQSCPSDDSAFANLVLASTPSPFKELGYGHYLSALEQARSKITYFASNAECCIIPTPELARKMQARRSQDAMAFAGFPASPTDRAENALVTPPSAQQAARRQSPSVCLPPLRQSMTRCQPKSAPPTWGRPTGQFQPKVFFHPPVAPVRHVQPMLTSPEHDPLLENASKMQYISTKSAREHAFFTHHAQSPPLISAQLSIPLSHMADSAANSRLQARPPVSSRKSAPSTFIPLPNCAPAAMQVHLGQKARVTPKQDRALSPPAKRAAMQIPRTPMTPLFKHALSPLHLKCRFSSTVSPLKPIRLIFSP